MRLAIALLGLAAGGDARADRYEAVASAQPIVAASALPEAGAASTMTVGGGLAVGFAWGIRNWLDVGGQLSGIAFVPAHYRGATEQIEGTPYMGPMTRTTRLTMAQVGGTVRLGIAWVPTIYVGLGAGTRLRTTGAFSPETAGGTFRADGAGAATTLDVSGTLRVGLDRRLGARWSVGVTAGATHYLGRGAPDLNVFDGQLAVAYRWYPLW
ncbi:MAG TPA: hypothetical protein VGM88_20380 [Kofleriaceae bacterium]|jgi:hypothetical protein